MSAVVAEQRSGLRLRNVHPLLDEQGRCALIYDLERTFVIEVPDRFQSSLADAIATADLDGPLGTWMQDEDLLTRDVHRAWGDPNPDAVPLVTDVSLDMSGSCNMGCVYCFEDAIDSRIGRMSEQTAFAALDFVFKKTAGAKRIALHFGSGEPLLRFDLLRMIVREADRRAADEGRNVSYDLTTNATLVTPEIAEFLSAHPFNVRVSCDGPPSVHDAFRPMKNGKPSYALVERGLKLLMSHLANHLTVNSVICGTTRLKDVWRWAKELGIRHYHVIKVGAYDSRNVTLQRAELARFRADLELICDDMLADLEAGRRPIDYQPITKVVRRLMIPQPITRFCGVAGSYLGVASDGKVYPCFRHLGLKDYHLGHVLSGVDDQKRVRFLKVEAANVDQRPICHTCWARYLCGGGCYADSIVYGPDKRKPQEDHCPLWRAEIDTAIRFYDRLRRSDPTYCLELFGDDIDSLLEKSGVSTPAFLQRKNCS